MSCHPCTEKSGDGMEIKNKIRVLIVDDSMVYREIMAKAVETDPILEVVGKASDPFEARDKILTCHPDVMVCDVEMPKMSGVEFVRRLIPQYPLPVVIVSSVSDAVFDAMSAGAVDFIEKPNPKSMQDAEHFIIELIAKIKTASQAKIITKSIKGFEDAPVSSYQMDKIIAFGASTGGTETLFRIFKNLPPNLPGILVVQHIPAVFSGMFAERLNKQTPLRVKEARSGDVVESGCVYIAPGDQHMRIKKRNGIFRIECFHGEKRNGHCPSVDILFESLAEEAGRQAVGFILTGMGSDGAQGLLKMRNNGARTFGQSENTCVVYGMPKAAYLLSAVEKQVAPDEIPDVLHNLLQKNHN